jgi:ABC-type phosphate/phosphonate transport system substrate-binding protein
MRDTDRDRVTHLVVPRDSAIDRVPDLRRCTIALGAMDSPQATLLPLHHLALFGLLPERDLLVRRHDVLVGKHGDHVGGERDAFMSVSRGETAAAAVLDLNWSAWQADGTADPTLYTILTTTAPFDHCNFTVLDRFPVARERQWTDVLFRMRYDNPAHKEMMDLEGLKAWLPGRTSGYSALAAATEQFHYFEARTV